MEAKKQLATYFVSIEAKDIKVGQKEREHFEKKFSQKELGDGDFQTVTVAKGASLLDALMQSTKFTSRAELKRLLAGNAIKNLDTNMAFSSDIQITEPLKVKVGKLHFFNIIF